MKISKLLSKILIFTFFILLVQSAKAQEIKEIWSEIEKKENSNNSTANSNENTRHAFYVNGSEIEEMYNEPQTYANSSNFLVYELSANDTVVPKYNTDSSSVEGAIHGGYKIFVGFKIG